MHIAVSLPYIIELPEELSQCAGWQVDSLVSSDFHLEELCSF